MQLSHKANLRADGAWVLYQILEEGKSSRECLAKVQQRHNSRDSAWLQEMTMGALRHLPQLQVWLRDLLDKPLKGNKKILEHLIMLGLYQIAYSRVSDHAGVGETVNAAPLLGGQSLKGLINAILRNFIRQDLAQHKSDDPRIASGFPKWLYNAVSQAYPDQWQDILQQSNQVAPVWLRVNTLKTTVADFTQALDDANIKYLTSAAHPSAIILQQRLDIPSLPGFELGHFSVQDGAAQLAASYLEPAKGERILDCCAAPGGKTSHIVELQPALKTCVALDNEARRLGRMQENMDRLGHKPEIICADATDLSSWWDNTPFDRILLDAPCSATGVIRRHPDIRWLRKKSDIDALVALQGQILRTLWQTLKPQGTLLYATCSILPQENTQQIASFLAEQTDATLLPFANDETRQNPGRQILPGEQQMDGFYYARLIKS